MTAVELYAALVGALRQHLEDNELTPCLSDPAPFTSDDRDERAEAATACGGCRVRTLCGRYALAAAEPLNVWGGVDLTPRMGPGRQGRELLADLYAASPPRDPDVQPRATRAARRGGEPSPASGAAA